MNSANSKLNKLENTPAVQRLTLVKEFSTEELRILAHMRPVLIELGQQPIGVFERLYSRAVDRRDGKL